MIARTHKKHIPLVSKNGHRLPTRYLTNDCQIIPPQSECLTPLSKQHQTEDIDRMVEPIQNQELLTDNLLISRYLVTEDALYTRVANLTNQPTTQQPNQVICRFISSSMLQIEENRSPSATSVTLDTRKTLEHM